MHESNLPVSPTSGPHTLESFESIPNKRQRHISRMFIPQRIHSSPFLAACIILRDFINGKVAHINSGLQIGFEWCTDAAELVPGDAAEEGVGFDFLGAILAVMAAKTVADVAEHTKGEVVSFGVWLGVTFEAVTAV